MRAPKKFPPPLKIVQIPDKIVIINGPKPKDPQMTCWYAVTY